jgi:hypothetical protein
MFEKSTRDVGKELEYFVAEKLQEIDKYARPSKNSGAANEISDVLNKYCYVQCKVSNISENINIKIKDWKKLLEETPINSIKDHIFVNQNSERKRFVTMDAEDFFKLYVEYKRLKENE